MTTPVTIASSNGDLARRANAGGSSRSHSLVLNNRRRRFSMGRGFVTASNVMNRRNASIDFPRNSARRRAVGGYATTAEASLTLRLESGLDPPRLLDPVPDPAP